VGSGEWGVGSGEEIGDRGGGGEGEEEEEGKEGERERVSRKTVEQRQ